MERPSFRDDPVLQGEDQHRKRPRSPSELTSFTARHRRGTDLRPAGLPCQNHHPAPLPAHLRGRPAHQMDDPRAPRGARSILRGHHRGQGRRLHPDAQTLGSRHPRPLHQQYSRAADRLRREHHLRPGHLDPAHDARLVAPVTDPTQDRAHGRLRDRVIVSCPTLRFRTKRSYTHAM